jgi:hypothetical protein
MISREPKPLRPSVNGDFREKIDLFKSDDANAHDHKLPGVEM